MVAYLTQPCWRGEGLVLLQLGILEFVDSPREALPLLRSGCEVGY